MTQQHKILDFWFGELGVDGLPASDHNKLWFGYSEETDAIIQDSFGSLVKNALAGELQSWLEDDHSLVAYVILLDQFTRNIYRGSPSAFAGDNAALTAAELAVESGRHLAVPLIHRVFLYIPFEHSEDLAVQNRGVKLFDELLTANEKKATPDVLKVVAGYRQYSVAHRDVISKFGRFPHRNDILGRESTPAELEHLASHGGF